MYFAIVALVAAAQLSAASTLDYKFSHDPISMGLEANLLSNRINSEDYLPGVVDEIAFNQHRQLADYAGYGEYAPIFESKAFPPEDYVRFQGLDETALFATSVSISNDFAIIGSNGYSKFTAPRGLVCSYEPLFICSCSFVFFVLLNRYLPRHCPRLHSCKCFALERSLDHSFS